MLDDLHMVAREWQVPEVDWHINCLELLAVELTLWAFSSCLWGSIVLVRSDNMTACTQINKQGGTHAPDLCLHPCSRSVPADLDSAAMVLSAEGP